MTEFGKTLREAREQKGLTIAQIAEQTHLLPQIVEDLENEDFHRISAPIYGRGFVKLYCESVGLEPKPLVDEFMAILNGERAPAIRVKEVALPEEPSAPAEPVPPPPPVYTQPELGDETPVASEGQGVRPETRDVSADEGARQETRDLSEDVRQETPAPQPRQYHPDYAQSVPAYGPSVNFGRLAILAGGAIILIALLFFGGRALYRASMGVTSAPEAQEVKETETQGEGEERAKPEAKAPAKAEAKAKPEAKAPAKPAAKKQPRTPKTVPPLYID